MTGGVRKQPVRTCIACREARAKKDLIRVVRTPEGEILVDPTGKANGRGAYICADETCFDQAINKGKLAAALKTPLDKEAVTTLKADFLALLEKKRTSG